ncbi:multidrug efflux pump subunit AcrB [Roseivirga pacifica]|uniref:Multidrug efflux pump subunit AcrB n=1 Tax=Roseivirga pacifica TaxID=1267423 RepID=A0A1I0RK08_9BACT|nr:efflux RND transporter permease subunit [Roseivirga pacifica]RKQ49795.1 multidrug efflux pump subunit AcrB [Roseivirga pacifica]SEW41379.1 Multidrug efflux pump subunit AcrB [Roseivirga pacifica]
MTKHTGNFRLVILFVALAIVGLATVPALRVNFSPTYTKPALTITYSLSNASPDIVERLATSPLENAFSQLEGVNKVYSISRYNSGTIELSFDKGEDMAFRKFEVNGIIRNIYKKLPENLSYPQVEQRGGEEQNESKSPIFQYSINGAFAPYKLQRDVEEYITKPLAQIKGIENIEVHGGNPLQITVDFDVPTLQRYHLSKASIASALSGLSQTVYAGLAKSPNGDQFFLKTADQVPDVKALEQTQVGMVKQKPVLLKDVAKVYVEEQTPTSYRRINAKNAVYMYVYARQGVNKIVLSSEIKQKIEALKQLVPDGIDVRLERDDTEYLGKEMDKIYVRTALSVGILILFILAINRNVRYLLTLFLGIVVNLCITAIFIYALNVELHIYSIAGLTISFGLIVDNAIVMIDHMYRKKNRKVFMALFAASLTTIMALLMVLLLPEEDRRDLTDFSVVVAINLAVSLLIALFFTPALYQLLFKEKIGRPKPSIKSLRRKVRGFKRYENGVGFLVRYRKAFIVLVILGFGLPIFKLPITWEGQEWYNKSIGSDTYQDDIRPITDKVFGGALRKFVQEVYEGYGYRSPQQTKLNVNARLPFGTTLEDANYVIGKVEEYLTEVKGIDKFVTNVNNRTARIEITFEEAYENSGLPYQLKGRLQARSIDLTGVRWSIHGVGQGFSAGGESNSRPSFRIKMKGYNFDELAGYAEIMSDTLLGHNRVQEVNDNAQLGWGEQTSEYVLDFDVDRLATAGINRGAITGMLQDLTLPRGASLQANFDDERLPVVIKANNAAEFSRYDLMEEALPLDTARFVKLNNYANLTFEQTANEIHKEDRQYLRVVAFEYLGSGKFGDRYRTNIVDYLNSIMPVGYESEASSYTFSMAREKRQYSLLLFLILGIYFICAILFENLRQPFHIIVTIPISFIGLFLIFSLFDFSFDQGGYAAFVMLGGLVVNASIFIVNDLNTNNRLRNYNRLVLRSVLGKAQPILLTILSTCFGLIPFLLEGESEVFWFALAIGTIGGLVFSTVAVFVCLPVFLSKKKLAA